MKILITDDNLYSLEVITEIIADGKNEIIKARDGSQAVEIFKNSEVGEIELIFTDIIMENISGDEAAREIRALDRADAKTVKIYAISAIRGYSAEVINKDNVFDGMIAKPIKRTELLEIING